MKNLILIISCLILIGIGSIIYSYSRKNSTYDGLTIEPIPITATQNTKQAINLSNYSKITYPKENISISSNSLFNKNYVNTLYSLEKYINKSSDGTFCILSNIDYYSIVNNKKYYVIYKSSIPGINYFDAGTMPSAIDQNYSGVSNPIYMDVSGDTISRQQFLNGNKSFHVSNLTNQEIYDQIYKLALEYKYAPITPENYESINNAHSSNDFKLNSLDYNSNDLIINPNITVMHNDQVFYQASYVKNEPFYISITGNVYVSKEDSLASIFNVPISQNKAEPTGNL